MGVCVGVCGGGGDALLGLVFKVLVSGTTSSPTFASTVNADCCANCEDTIVLENHPLVGMMCVCVVETGAGSP